MRNAARFSAVTATAIALGVAVISTAAMGFAPPPGPTTTTRPAIAPVIVQPTTTRPSSTTTRPSSTTTTTSTPVFGDPTTTRPAVAVATTPTTPTTPTTQAVIASATTPTSVAEVELASPSTAELQVAQATVPQTSGEQIALGELSTDPADWSDDVIEHLESQGVVVDALGDSVAHDQPGELVSNEGCAVQCITDGVAWAVGTGAHLRVTTSVPATIRITVFGEVPANVTSPTSDTNWGHTWPHLNEDQTYTALASATDATGNQAFASGDFTTLSRFVSVQIVGFEGQAQLPYEHFHLQAWVNGAEHVAIEGNVDLPWGGVIFTPVPPTLEIEILGVLHDHDAGGPFSGDIAAIYGSVAQTFELDSYPPTATYWTEHSIDTEMWTEGWDFAYETQIQIGVTYADPNDYP